MMRTVNPAIFLLLAASLGASVPVTAASAGGDAAALQAFATEAGKLVKAQAEARALARARKAAEKADEEGEASADAAAADAEAAVAEAMAMLEDELSMEDAGAIELEEDEPVDPLGDEALARWKGDIGSYKYGKAPRLQVLTGILNEALPEGGIPLAAERVAERFGLTPDHSARLVRLWILADHYEYEWVENAEQARELVRSDLAALVRETGHDTLVVQAAGTILETFDECQTGQASELLASSPDPVRTAWDLASATYCVEHFGAFVDVAPDKAMPALYAMGEYGHIDFAARLPLSGWFISDAALERVAEADRTRLARALRRDYLANLLKAGAREEALEFFASLDPGEQAGIFESDAKKWAATIDGLAIMVETDEPDTGLALGMATAFYLAGETDEAARLLAMPLLASPTDQAARCMGERGTDDCRRVGSHAKLALLLRHLIETPGDDPYPVAEAYFSGHGFVSADGTLAELPCLAFAEDRFGDICTKSKTIARYSLVDHQASYKAEDFAAVVATIERAQLPGWPAVKTLHDELLSARLAQTKEYASDSHDGRASIDPVYPRFAEKALGEEFVSPAVGEAAGGDEDEDREWPSAWAELPRGFWPVRWEDSGEHVTAVSLSPWFDRNGEISPGGYWIHLSEDGGRSWSAPLYTGLAQHWPYVVRSQSLLPMRLGDTIQLEVEVQELDTASITYPPVGLRTRREQSGLYLEIPLARLRADSDSDGLSDLAEEHLLLDRKGSERPFALGSDGDGSCTAAPGRLTLAKLAILEAIFQVKARPVYEPVNPDPESLVNGVIAPSASTESAPLFLSGSPSDFACIATLAPVFVYTPEQVVELQRRSPDFRTVELPPIVFDRARMRGFVEWSAGWTGGTLVLTWNGSDWDVETTSQWIT